MNSSLTRHAAMGVAIVLFFVAAPALAQHGHADHTPMKEGASNDAPKCPVTDEPANLAISISTERGPLFFCCKNCIAKYRSKPGAYAAKAALQRKMLAARPKVQVTCPVTGQPVNSKIHAEHDGAKIHFCSEGCAGKFNSDPGKYKTALANSYTYQTKCPVMNAEIDPTVFTTLASGMKVYFCCPGCDKKFVDNPDKYAQSLASQGFILTPPAEKKDEHGGHDHDDHGHAGHDHG